MECFQIFAFRSVREMNSFIQTSQPIYCWPWFWFCLLSGCKERPTHDVIKSLLRQNNVVSAFWRYDVVVIAQRDWTVSRCPLIHIYIYIYVHICIVYTWNASCARATAFIFDTRTDILVEVFETENVLTPVGLESIIVYMPNAQTNWAIGARHFLFHVLEHWLWWHWYNIFVCNVNTWIGLSLKACLLHHILNVITERCRGGNMMTSSNGNIFRVTGPLLEESTGDRWVLLTEASDAELWCFLWSAPEQTVAQSIEALVIWDTIVLIMTSLLWNPNPKKQTKKSTGCGLYELTRTLSVQWL